MDKLKHNKEQRQKLRQLAEIAYDRELTEASAKLLLEFRRWENREIDVFELNNTIHEFHNGISRTLYTRYSGMDTTFGVVSALHRGILSREEVGDDVYVEGFLEASLSLNPS